MASSRIFVTGLPPRLSEKEFEAHFSRQQSITDAKLMPKRQMGFVGYKSPEDAAKAVKYFNKSFMRLSRIHVELARPVADTVRKNLPHEGPQRVSTNVSPPLNVQPAEAAAIKSLKRKRDEPHHIEEDPKLKEFLQVMQAPSKSKPWEDVGVTKPEGGTTASDGDLMAVEAAADDSDAEYQAVPKKSRPGKKSSADALSELQPPVDGTTSRVDGQSETDAHDDHLPTAEVTEEATEAQDKQVSDADWLRSRTSRLLGLADQSSPEPRPVDDTDGVDQGAASPPGPQLLETSTGADMSSTATAEEKRDDGHHDHTDSTAIRESGRLFLRNLPYSVSEDDLREQFAHFASLEEVHVPLDPSSGAAKGFAYLSFSNSEDAVQAHQSMDGTIFQGRLLHILPAAAKRTNKLDEFAMSKLPLKKQRQIQRKAEAASSNFNWNALYMNADAVMWSVSDRLGVSKSDLLDPTSSDAAVKQAQAETHIIQETKSYFAKNGVDLDAFKKRERGDSTILVKNFPYGTKPDELRKLFEEHGQITKLLMPSSGTIAIVEFAQAPQARSAFAALAYRKMKDSILFLEKAPKGLFGGTQKPPNAQAVVGVSDGTAPKLSTTELLQPDDRQEVVDSTTLFVRNLNFSTTTERLAEIFKPLDGFLSARVKTKTGPKKPSQTLSMGFGFLEFRTKAQAQAALRAMNNYNLDGHNLVIKASHKGLDAAEERRREDKARKAAGRKTKIVIKNLPFEASKKDVRALFGSYGQLRSVRVPKKFDSSTRGFAFAEFTTPREAENAMDALRNTHLLGRRLVLDFAEQDPEDAEEEIEKMQKKVGSQINKVALQKLTSGGRKKFSVSGNDELDAT